MTNTHKLIKSPAYKIYHARVVEACVLLMGEQYRKFFETQCDYLEEFAENMEPDDVAMSQRESL